MQNVTPNKDWKNNPIIVAAGAVAATALLSITIFKEIVIPTQTARFEIEALKAKDSERNIQAEFEKEKAQRIAFERKITELNAKINLLDEQLKEIREGEIFQIENPYPIGLGVVRVGSPAKEIYKYFSKDKIEINEKKPEEITVTLGNSPFSSVHFSTEKNDSEKRIAHISFFLDYKKKFKKDFLEKKIIQALGRPSQNPEENYYRWSDSAGVSVYLIDETYMLMKPKYQPAIWVY